MTGSLRTLGFDNWHDTDEGEDSASAEQTFEAEVPGAQLSSSSSSDSSSSCLSSSENDSDGSVSASIGAFKHQPLEGVELDELRLGNLYYHRTFRTVHCLSDVDLDRFSCGRVLRSTYRKLKAVKFDWPKCMVCFKPYWQLMRSTSCLHLHVSVFCLIHTGNF